MGSISLSVTVLAESQLSRQQQTKQQLILLRHKINTLSRSLQANRKLHSVELFQLNLSEKQISLLTYQLQKNTRQQKRERSRLEILHKKHKISRQLLARQLSHFAGEARLAFLQGRMSVLKIILSKQSLAFTQRGLVYHRYMRQYRQKRIVLINRQLVRLQKIKFQLIQKSAELKRLHISFRQQRTVILNKDKQRRRLLRQLQLQMKSERLRLQAYKKSRLELAVILQGIKASLGNLPVTNRVFKSFHFSKGKLNWPVSGVIDNSFGQSTENSLHSRGIFIQVVAGSPVSSISHGRVVYADWLRGYGLIVIIDHSDHYLSLYGHNQVLYKQVGDWVKTGEIIAATGDSGGLGHSGLYFEIRRRGIPLNPSKWCRKFTKKTLSSNK